MKLIEKGIPLYYQIEGYMKKKIMDGEWAVGEKIPTENELMELFDVSRATLRQAVGNLCNNGLLVRLQGRGTFVRSRTLYIEDYTKIWYERDPRHIQETISIETVDGTAINHICDRMKVNESTRFAAIKYIHLNYNSHGREPSNYTVSYFPLDRFPDIESCFGSDISIYQLLETHYDVHIDYAKSLFNAVCLEKQIAAHLMLPADTPVVKIEKVYYDAEDKPIYLSEIYLHPHNNRLEYRSRS
ncbi:MAG: GntR family transcriptional regulator [Lachnospiraceae bacterium]|nr:GntR family transcriptional regulator [Lachnospiraceae bacterium]